MSYKVIIINMIGMSNQQVIAAMESQMNAYADDGFRYVSSFNTENKWLYVIMGKSPEKRGRPKGKSEDDEITSMPD